MRTVLFIWGLLCGLLLFLPHAREQVIQGGSQPINSQSLDSAFGSTRGSILERSATGWVTSVPGTAGFPWVSNGSGADPAYQSLTGVGITNATITGAKIANATITGSNIANSTIANSNLTTMAASTVKCNPTAASTGGPIDCQFMCIIDGTTFPATIAGIQSAINVTACREIYIPSGVYSGTALLQIARSNIKIHGAGGITSPQGISNGATAGTILSFSCFGGVLAPAVQVGDNSATLTYGGIDISDLEVVLPSACNMIGLEVKASTPDSGNMLRRVRVTELSGNSVGAGIWLDQLVYSWRFEDVIVDHFFDGYHFVGQNHFTQVVGGQVRNNQVGFNHQSTLASSNIVVANVDIEGNTQVAIDIYSTSGFVIRDNYIDNGFSASTLGVRVGQNASFTPEGVMIQSNYFNNGGTANYAIDLEAGGFNGLQIIGNHFNSFAVSNILNNAAAARAQRGAVFSNDWFGSATYATAWTGFYLNDPAINRNFTVGQLPTCNFFMQGARYFVNDYSGTVAWKQAAVGGGSVGVGTVCDGANWYID